MSFFSYLSPIVAKVSPAWHFRLAYLHNRGKFPNLRTPKDISEILIRRVLDGKVNEIYSLADKYQVREHIKQKGYVNLLTPLLGVYRSPEEIDFNELPNRFAIKMNYGAGMNIICTNKSRLSIDETRAKLTSWLQNSIFSFAERHYNLIEKRIIVEEFIDDGNGGFPIDYKFMCIRGKVACILACNGRESGHGDYLPYSTDWQPLYEYCKNNNRYSIQLLRKPSNLQEMIQVAEDLSSDIDVVRVDLYSNGSQIWFGEMTLTPAGCILHRWTQKALDDLGEKYNYAN